MTEQAPNQATADISSTLAGGRTYAEFLPLSAAEAALRDAARDGSRIRIGSGLPTRAPRKNGRHRVRAGFVRFLALGGDYEAPVHERGVDLSGAWFSDLLDFTGTAITAPLCLMDCVINGLSLDGAELRSLNLTGSHLLLGISASYLKCNGQIELAKTKIDYKICLFQASIGGMLSLIESYIDCSVDADGLNCGYINLRDAEVFGTVRLTAAKIGGDLILTRAKISARPPVLDAVARVPGDVVSHVKQAVIIWRARIGGSLFCDDFVAYGAVDLDGAYIAAGMSCAGASFINPGGQALCLRSATIIGRWTFSRIKAIEGRVLVGLATINTLIDDTASWAKADAIGLDGLRYDRFGGGAPTDAAGRIAWLDRQIAEHRGIDFRPQPWEQVIATLRAMGHADHARTVAIAKQERLRAAGKIRGARAVAHWLYGKLIGYGYQPERLVSLAFGVWLATSFAFWAAVNPGSDGRWLMTTTKPAAPDAVCVAAHVSAHDTSRCPAPPPDYATFFAPAYSLDVLLPVVNLGYKSEWVPVVADSKGNVLVWGFALRTMIWAEIIFGWVASLLLVGVVGKLIKRD